MIIDKYLIRLQIDVKEFALLVIILIVILDIVDTTIHSKEYPLL